MSAVYASSKGLSKNNRRELIASRGRNEEKKCHFSLAADFQCNQETMADVITEVEELQGCVQNGLPRQVSRGALMSRDRALVSRTTYTETLKCSN